MDLEQLDFLSDAIFAIAITCWLLFLDAWPKCLRRMCERIYTPRVGRPRPPCGSTVAAPVKIRVAHPVG